MGENDVIEVDNIELEVDSTDNNVVIDLDPEIYCSHAFPIYTHIIKAENSNIIAMSYLCRDGDDNLFILNRAYTVPEDAEEDILAFECLPFAEYETDHITRKLQFKWLNNYLPHYTTNMKFYVDPYFTKNNSSAVYTYAVDSKDNKKIKVTMPLEVYVSILFLDKYAETDCDSDHDLDLAIVNGAIDHTEDASFFIVDDVDIVSMIDATVQKEESSNILEKIKSKFTSKEELVQNNTNVAMVLKISRTNSEGNKETVQLLSAFDIGKTFDKSKFKGKTVDNIQDEYFKDGDQYSSTLIISEAKLYGVDKTYMVIRGVNNNKKSYIFLFDTLVIEDIKNKMDKF